MIGYSSPALVGTNVTLSCPSGNDSNLLESNSTSIVVLTCMDNDTWNLQPGQNWTCTSKYIYIYIYIYQLQMLDKMAENNIEN